MILSDEIFQVGPVLPNKFAYVSPRSMRPLGELYECDAGFTPPSCPNWPSLHGVSTRTSNRSFRLKGRALGDIIWGDNVVLLRDRWRPAIETEQFDGVRFEAADLFSDEVCTVPIKDYVEMRIVGRVPLDIAASGMTIEYRCPLCGETRYSQWARDKGIHFEGPLQEWPDVFRVTQGMIGYVFARRRFAQLLINLGLRPVMITRVEDLFPVEY